MTNSKLTPEEIAQYRIDAQGLSYEGRPGWADTINKLLDTIEAQAREIERLRDELEVQIAFSKEVGNLCGELEEEIARLRAENKILVDGILSYKKEIKDKTDLQNITKEANIRLSRDVASLQREIEDSQERVLKLESLYGGVNGN